MLQARSRSGASAETMVAQHDEPWLDRPAQMLLAAIVALGLVRAVLAASIGLTDDEAYYRLWALAPAWGYLDHPPMVGWMIAAGRWIAGDTPLGIRLGAVLTSLLGPLVLWRSAHILFGPAVARRAVWMALAMPLMAVGGVIITPDTPSVLFWGLAAWALAELHVLAQRQLVAGGRRVRRPRPAVQVHQPVRGRRHPAVAGVGCPAIWRWLRSWQLWAGGAIARLLAAPGRALERAARVGVVRQAVRPGRSRTGLDAHLSCRADRRLRRSRQPADCRARRSPAWCGSSPSAVRERNQAHILLVSGLLPLLVYFLVHALHSRVQANWLAPLYPAFAICAAIAIAIGHQRMACAASRPGRCRWDFCARRCSTHMRCIRCTLSPYSKDPSAQMRGWPRAGRRARTRCAARTAPAGSPPPATPPPDSSPITCAGKPRSRSSTSRCATSTCRRLDAETRACPALYVELERRHERDLLTAQFASVTDLGVLDRKYAGVPLARYVVHLLAEPRPGNPGTDVRLLR